MFTKEEDVIHFIFKAFKNQRRTKEDIETVYHSIRERLSCNMLDRFNRIVEIYFVE